MRRERRHRRLPDVQGLHFFARELQSIERFAALRAHPSPPPSARGLADRRQKPFVCERTSLNSCVTFVGDIIAHCVEKRSPKRELIQRFLILQCKTLCPAFMRLVPPEYRFRCEASRNQLAW